MPYVREYNEEREVAAWFLLDLSPSVDFRLDTGAQEGRRHRLRRGARALAHAPRQPRRRDVLRRQGRHGDSGAAAAAVTCCTSCTAWLTRPEAVRCVRHRPRRSVANCVSDDAQALGRLRHFRFHQRARLGGIACPSRAAPRGGRGAAVRSAGNGASRSRAAGHPGCRDGRADLRRHARPRLSEALCRRGGTRGKPSCAHRCATPASMPSSCRPTTISSTPSCASRTCASGAASSRQAAAFRSIWWRAMTFLWPEMLWALLVAAGPDRDLSVAAAAQEARRGALREPERDAGTRSALGSASAATFRPRCSW